MVLEAIFTVLVDKIITPVADYVVSSVKQHLCYAFNCDSQVQNLQEAVEKLIDEKDKVENAVAEAARNGKEIYKKVTTWLNNVETGIGEAEQLIQGKDEAKQACCVGACPNLKTRYQLSKKADKKATVINKLVQEAEGLDPISFRPPLKLIVEPSVYAQEALTSRVQILNQIMDALEDPNLSMIGVYGMGGVGKTKLAKEVQAKVMQEKMFENVILVAVSQTPELRRIQSEIAYFLGLRFGAEELPGRASQLYMRLNKSRVLLILDDIWQGLDLNAIGIPSGDSCKLLLTSRRRDVLRAEMRVQKEFSLGILGEKEAWKLFQAIAPKSVDPQFHAMATEVSKKCCGLPLLIIIVAKELQSKELYAWVDMLKQLSVTGNEDLHERVHKVLEKSFDNLPGEEVKSLFLLCSMFGQSNIQIQMLLIYSIGLGILKQKVTVQEARIRLLTLINELKADCLLLDGDMDGFVKMHDVVRDSAISIASRLQHAFVGAGHIGRRDWPSQNFTKISLPFCDVHELPRDFECPQADLFLLFTEDLSLEIPDSFFQGLRTLKVVDFTGMRLVSLPSSLGFVLNLHALSLQRCRLNSIDAIGKLKQLQLLSLSGSKIAELPREVEELTQLKLLDLSNCTMLRVIPANALLKLRLLEELYMLNSFNRWNIKGNASLMELEGLSNLSTLEIQIVNLELIPRGFKFFDGLRLNSFKIAIGIDWIWYVKYEKSKDLILKLELSVQLRQQIEGLLRGTEVLSLNGVRGINFGVENFPQLKHLNIENDSSNIQYLIKSKVRASFQAFEVLETLYLNNLKRLEKICDGQLTTGSFGKLQKLNVSGCHKLKSLFSISSAKCMSQLQELELNSCDSVEAVVVDGIEDGHDSNEVIEFSHLNSLKLSDLTELRCFHKKEAGNEQVKLLFNEMVYFPNLTSLVVHKCKNLNYIFTTASVKCLGKLQKLDVQYCDSVEEITLMRKSEGIVEEGLLYFLQLDSLQLRLLPNLRWFCCGHVLKFPSLKTLTIDACRAMENFVSRFSSTSNNNGSDGHFFNEMVTLSNLETMNASRLGSFRYLWDEKFIAGDSFCKLHSLAIVRCSKLQLIFPSNIYRRFQSLKTLSVEHCDGLKEIYQFERVDLEDDNIMQTFRSLQSVSVVGCEDLEYVFPESIACDLVQLQQLCVSQCGVEMIISKNSKGCPAHFKLPELAFVKLVDLNKMRSIYEGPYDLELPKLKSLEVYNCNETLNFGSKFRSYHGEDKNGTNNLCVQESMPFAEKFIPVLEELTIDHQGLKVVHESGVFLAAFFSKLKTVTVRSIDPESIQFLFNFLRRLNSVEMLVFVDGYFNSGFLFDDEKTVGEEEHVSTPKHLEIRSLQRLKHVVEKESPLNSIVQHLQTLVVDSCYDLMDIAASSASFHNLTTLNIYGCSNMKKLVTSSTAKTMVQLVHMRVDNCNAIEEIIATDANCTEHDVIDFNKLTWLELVNLHKINSFCSGYCTFNIPVLRKVTVKSCPKMKNFCCGILSTPKLRGILYDDEQQWEGDLNATIAFQLREWVGVHFEEWKFFQNIESVELVTDSFCLKVLSANQIQLLHRLKKIIVKDCELVEVVFDLEKLCVEDGHVGMLPKLNELHLINLPRLRKLCSKPHVGVVDFNNLVDLKLKWCNNFVQLPCLGKLPRLKSLEMSHMGKVKRIDNEFYGCNDERSSNGGFNIFPALQSLSLTRMDNLTEWSSPSDAKTVILFPRLQNLSIQSCPKLTGFPMSDISSLEELVVKDCEELMVVILENRPFAYLRGLSFKGCSKLTNLLNWLIPPAKSFKELIVSRCEWLTVLPYDLQKVSNLTSLEIYYCRRLRYFPEDILFKLTNLQHLSIGAFSEELDDFCYLNRIKDLRRLKELEIWGSDFLGREMRFLPNQLQHLSALKSLKVMGFTAMEALPEWLTNLQDLGSLSLDCCRNLKCNSTATITQRLLNLTHLNIRSCPILHGSDSEWLQPLHSRKIEVELSHVSEVRVRLGY